MVATVGSDDVNVQAPGEDDCGGVRKPIVARLGPKGTVMFANVPTFGVAAEIVSVIVSVTEPNPPAGNCFALIIAVPADRGVNVVPTSAATEGLSIVKTQGPLLVEVGAVRLTLEMLYSGRLRLRNGPTVGTGAIDVNVIDADV